MVRAPVFQTGDEGSIPFTRSLAIEGFIRWQTSFKCQGNYLTGLGVSLKAAIKDGVITDKRVVSAINSLLASDLNFSVGDPKNKERIRRINDTLNQVITALQ